MRKWINAVVKSCPGQVALTGDRVYGPASVEGDEPGDSPTRPFIVIHFSTHVRGLGGVKQQRVQVWVHDDKTTMLPVDGLIADLEEHVPAQAPQSYDGDWIMDCVWEDTSGDGFDDHFNTNVRYITFLVTYKPGV